jgi:hypothetical protein
MARKALIDYSRRRKFLSICEEFERECLNRVDGIKFLATLACRCLSCFVIFAFVCLLLSLGCDEQPFEPSAISFVFFVFCACHSSKAALHAFYGRRVAFRLRGHFSIRLSEARATTEAAVFEAEKRISALNVYDSKLPLFVALANPQRNSL